MTQRMKDLLAGAALAAVAYLLFQGVSMNLRLGTVERNMQALVQGLVQAGVVRAGNGPPAAEQPAPPAEKPPKK